jgi:polyphosphate kinase
MTHKKPYSELPEEFLEEMEEELEEEMEANSILNIEAIKKIKQEYRKNIQDMDCVKYFIELQRLQIEMVRLQDWISETGQKVVILFEGRDAAGKGGMIKRITQKLNPRVCRVVALNKPTEKEKTQWYFQRYVQHLPCAGEMVLFDRSWYNRAGVERVMGFCSEAELEEFFSTVPDFERMLIGSGIRLLKYWFSVSDQEQEFRFLCRLHDPTKQWKLSPMDLQSRICREDYTLAKEEMMKRTSIVEAPWNVVPAICKRKARLNCMLHLLSKFDYYEILKENVTLPERRHGEAYKRNDFPKELIIPEIY